MGVNFYYHFKFIYRRGVEVNLFIVKLINGSMVKK